jgi:hypothetical protein
MPTPSSGTIKFSNLSNEFGPTTNVSLGAYRLNGGQTAGTLSNLPLDTDIPKSGSISMSQFYNKRLNVVINYTNLPDNSTRLNARQSYDNGSPGEIVVIGGFRNKPTNPQNIKLFINTNTRIGSAPGAITNVALRTGNWRDSNNNALTSVVLECGISSKIYGAGGKGGNANGSSGANGTSAIGIDYPTTVNNQGRIQRGGGGGGAGAFRQYAVPTGKKGKSSISSYSTGGGGGGGAGFPFGAGGSSVGGAYGVGSNGSGGASGSHESAGAAGAGGVEAGSGGSGGQFGNGNAGGGTANQGGGSGGAHGFAFVIGSGGSKSGGGGTIEGGDVSAEPT